MAINASSVLMPMLFGSAGALIGIAGVFWATGAMVGAGSRLAWLLRDGMRFQAGHPAAPPVPVKKL